MGGSCKVGRHIADVSRRLDQGAGGGGVLASANRRGRGQGRGGGVRGAWGDGGFSSQVLDVLCSLCVCHGVAVRSNQHLICDNLLPGRDLLLQTRLVNHVSRLVQMTVSPDWRPHERSGVLGL